MSASSTCPTLTHPAILRQLPLRTNVNWARPAFTGASVASHPAIILQPLLRTRLSTCWAGPTFTKATLTARYPATIPRPLCSPCGASLTFRTFTAHYLAAIKWPPPFLTRLNPYRFSPAVSIYDPATFQQYLPSRTWPSTGGARPTFTQATIIWRAGIHPSPRTHGWCLPSAHLHKERSHLPDLNFS